ncbi:hypothetical protein, partial [Faecalibacterium prausnitzii]|uniref:hypothetical protein n=1 Tax=Faecalibacterium prausnitzii TaxID=853 RepID=UPI001A9A9649
LLFVLIAVFHKNTPNTGCPVLGVHIRRRGLRRAVIYEEGFRKVPLIRQADQDREQVGREYPFHHHKE